MDDQLFTVPFYHYSQSVYEQIRNEVQRLGTSQLGDMEAVIANLVAKYRLTELNIDWDSLAVLPNHREEESYHRDVFDDEVRTVTPVYTFEVKYSGSPVLFTIQPGTSRMIRLEGDVTDQTLSFEIQDSDKSRLEQIEESVKFNIDNQKNDVGGHNSGVESTARTAVEQRKQELEKHGQGLNAFGVPVKNVAD